MIRLNPTLQEQIVAAIRAGGFPHVAAAAFGVSQRTFARWRKLGRCNEGDAELCSFARAIDVAIAQARLRAEMEIFAQQPRLWLQHGPGRETSDCVGWTALVKPAAKNRGQHNPFLNAVFMERVQKLLAILEPFPELREQARDVFDPQEKRDHER